jgi:hypothetical protein
MPECLIERRAGGADALLVHLVEQFVHWPIADLQCFAHRLPFGCRWLLDAQYRG